MTFIEAFILAFAQGVTEFLPISSSGHLAIIPFLFHFQTQSSIAFNVMLHVATLIAVIIFLWKDICSIVGGIFSGKKESWSLVGKILLAVIPAGIVGIAFEDTISHIFIEPQIVGWAYFGTAALLFLSYFLKDGNKTMQTITWTDCLLIGVFQAFALVPGFSRSGFTLVGALLIGMRKEDAFRFSFLVSIPAILGAFLLEATSVESIKMLTTPSSITAFVVAILVGLASLWLLKIILKSKKLYWFGFYCLALGIVLITIF